MPSQSSLLRRTTAALKVVLSFLALCLALVLIGAASLFQG
jgi:CHASE3 domain sensor protein